MSDHDQPRWPIANNGADSPEVSTDERSRGAQQTVELRRPEPESPRPEREQEEGAESDADPAPPTDDGFSDDPDDGDDRDDSDEVAVERDDRDDVPADEDRPPTSNETVELRRPETPEATRETTTDEPVDEFDGDAEPAGPETEAEAEDSAFDPLDEHSRGDGQTMRLARPDPEAFAQQDDSEQAEPDHDRDDRDDTAVAEPEPGPSEVDEESAADEVVPSGARTAELPRPDPGPAETPDEHDQDDFHGADQDEDFGEEHDVGSHDDEDHGQAAAGEWDSVGQQTVQLRHLESEGDAEPELGLELERDDDLEPAPEARRLPEQEDQTEGEQVTELADDEPGDDEPADDGPAAEDGHPDGQSLFGWELVEEARDERASEPDVWPSADEPAVGYGDETLDEHEHDSGPGAETPSAWPTEPAGPTQRAEQVPTRWPGEESDTGLWPVEDEPSHPEPDRTPATSLATDRTDERADRGYATGELPRIDVEALAESPAERTSQIRPVSPPPRENPAEQTRVLRPVQPHRPPQRPNGDGERQGIAGRPQAPQPARIPLSEQTQVISAKGLRGAPLAGAGGPGYRADTPQRSVPVPVRPLDNEPRPDFGLDTDVDGGVSAGVDAEPAAEREPAPRRRRGMLVALGAVVLVIALGAGAVFAVPGLRAKLGLGGEPEVAIAPAPAPVAFQPSLHAPSGQAPAPTEQGVRSALSGPAGASVLGTLTGSVIDPATGKVLWERDAGKPQIPASTGKILAAAAALLSMDHTQQFVTKVVAGDEPGTVILVGGGDPTLSSLPVGRTSVYPGAAHLDDLVTQVKANAGGQVSKVLVDQSRYQGENFAPGWLRGDIGAGYITPIVPAMLDGGRMINPNDKDGTRTDNPGRALAAGFAQRIGATVPARWEATAPQGAKVLGEVRSAPLVELVDNLLLISDNVLAETVAHEVAKATGEEPSFEGASRATLKILQDNGFDVSGAVLSDASGLSTEDNVSAGLITNILAVAAAPDGADPRTAKLRPLLGGLPVAGGSGTLSDRYQTAPASAGRGWARAKTGTLPDGEANSLAGLVLDVDGRVLVFTFISSSSNGSKDVRAALDVVVAALRQCGCRS